MILFIRDNECFEPRVQNYLRYFKENNIPYKVIAWNRTGTAVPDENIQFFQRRAEYGKRIANIPNKAAWMYYVFKEIYRNRKDCELIHACDIDAVLPALIVGKMIHKAVIFDIFDWISSLTGKGAVYKLTELLQNLSYKYADYVILCEEERRNQAKTENRNVMVLPNIPNNRYQFHEEVLEKTSNDLNKYRLVLSYVGVFDKDRGLENLLETAAAEPDIKLNIAGFGVLEEEIKEFSRKYDNIKFWGRVDYITGQTIMKNSSIIVGMYYLSSPLHRYAAPNKFYESLKLGVPLLTTEGTLVANKVKKYGTGFVIEPTKESLGSFLHFIKKDSIEQVSERCTAVWNDVYCTYFDDFMRNKYMKIIDTE